MKQRFRLMDPCASVSVQYYARTCVFRLGSGRSRSFLRSFSCAEGAEGECPHVQ